MPLKLEEADVEDIKDIVDIIFEAHRNPYSPYVDLMTPGFDPTVPPGHQNALEKPVQRVRQQYESVPREKMVWIKIVDTETSKIIAASRWVIHEGDGYAEQAPPVKAPWLPEGSKIREYAEFTMQYRADLVTQRCRRAHIFLMACVTDPAHRRRGAASMMLKWGLDKADKMGYESFLESTILGQQVYENVGFVSTGEVCNPRKPKEESDEEWKAMEENWPLSFHWMWRPAKGSSWEKGMSFPWEIERGTV